MLVLKVESYMDEAQEFRIFVLYSNDFRMTKINVDCVLPKSFLGYAEGFKLGLLIGPINVVYPFHAQSVQSNKLSSGNCVCQVCLSLRLDLVFAKCCA